MISTGGKCVCKEKILSPVAKYSDMDPALCLELQKIVETITMPGKGLLACDESPTSLKDRFEEIGIENTDKSRRDYRQMLFSADKSVLSQYISGIILHHETVYQKTTDGIEIIEFLRERNIIPGIKVDQGLVQLFGSKNEKTTQGLDNLQERCIQYKKDCCHFAKWRCVFSISETTPSQLAMVTNANILARYASICQSARIVPIIEPEVLNAGVHNINKSREIHEELFSILFRTLNEHRVYLEGIILKPAMVLSGIESMSNCTPQVVAEHTLLALQRTVPPAVPAILFLSGGQSDDQSILNLNAINAYAGKKPWKLSFCFGRALQNTALQIWKGKIENVKEAQATFLKIAKRCSEAALGTLEI